MTERRHLVLSKDEEARLKRMAKSDPKPYKKMRAHALLLIAQGHAPYWVARHGLKRPIDPNQVYEWLNRYQAEGIEGLAIRRGRGRKPAGFPRALVGGGL